MIDGSHVQNPMEIWGDIVTTTGTITNDCSNTAGRVHMYIDDKKRKINTVYTSGSWMDEDPYGIMKVK